MKVACYRGLTASDNEQEEAQRKRKIMNNDVHNKGSEVSHRRLSDGEFDRELAMTKVQFDVLKQMLQESEKDHGDS